MLTCISLVACLGFSTSLFALPCLMYWCECIPRKMSGLLDDTTVNVLRKRKDGDPISKKKHRRGRRRRKWKSYSEMSLEERHELERKEEEKTAKIEAKLAKLGRPTAPFNSNTFLIEDREDNKLVEECMLRFLKRSQSANSPSADEDVEEMYESPEDSLSEEEELLERDFQAQYEEACRERFDELKKEDLVDECIKLEETLQRVEEDSRQRIAALESELTTLRRVAHASTDSNAEQEELVERRNSGGHSSPH